MRNPSPIPAISHSLILQFTQECPSGVVNEETFKQIYAQFFPHGGEYILGKILPISFPMISLPFLQLPYPLFLSSLVSEENL